MHALKFSLVAGLLLGSGVSHARPAEPADLVRLKTVSSADIAPDGQTIVYVVSSSDVESDKSTSHIWTVNWDGTGDRQLTAREGESESSPKFSPDGTYIGFLSSRGGDENKSVTKLWLLPKAGGEARPIEGIEGSVEAFSWSPDGKRLALVVMDPEPEKTKTAKGDEVPPVIVIDRYAFKQDGTGYLDNRKARIWIYDLASGKAGRLTDGDYDESDPQFSPSGSHIAFVSKRVDDPDRTIDSNIFVVDAAAGGATPSQLTEYPGADHSPRWSPDGKSLTYLRGGDNSKAFNWYEPTELGAVNADGSEERSLTADLDRNLEYPFWSANGKSIFAIVEDDGNQHLVEISRSGGSAKTVVGGERDISQAVVSSNGRIAVLSSTMLQPPELFAVEKGKTRRLTEHNDALMAELDLGTTERYSATNPDGTEVHGFITYPSDYAAGEAMPTIMHLHGGPTSQFDTGFQMLRHVIAGAGYVVVAPNPRGSTGRGVKYSSGIDGAWGSVDVGDVLASADHAVAAGIADADRMGVGGWSYGGMLTNYVIASDTRFKAAMSGASIGNVLSGYGTDHYVLAYEQEMGKPWENLEGWMNISYPFFQSQKIITPTLFMVGEEDVNVPTLASEQMYQALKSRGLDTRLVIYPGQAHGIRRPSYQIDRAKRWIGWFDKYLGKAEE